MGDTMKKKPTVMVLGVYHFDTANNRDLLKIEAGDVLSKQKQKEITELIDCLAKFKPQAIALEYEKTHQSSLSDSYHRFQTGKQSLTVDERQQIGFRLANHLNLEDVYAVDWNKEIEGIPNVFDWGEKHQQKAYQAILNPLKASIEEENTYGQSHSISERLRRLNESKRIKNDHLTYMQLACLGDDKNLVGAEWVAQYWYFRNLVIYGHLSTLIQEGYERILVIYGAAHVHLLQQFLLESDLCEIESPLAYL